MSPPSSDTAVDAKRFPEIAGIDRERAEVLLNGEREFFMELLRQFVTEYGVAATRVETLLEQGDRATAAAYLHKVRGTAGYLGVTEVVNASRELEQAINAGTGDARALLVGYARAMSSLLAAAAPWIGNARPQTGNGT